MRGLGVLGAAGLLMAGAGCGGSSAVDRSPAQASCETRVPAAGPSDTVTVVLFDTVDFSHAPWGRNREERFVFSHLYETLVTIDCHGEVQPGLAKSWRHSSDGWLIELRDDAHFWDDSPVTARDVVASFEPAIGSKLAIASADVVDEHHVLISRQGGAVDLKLFALPILSVTKPNKGGVPLGTGLWRVNDGESGGDRVMMRPASGDELAINFVRRQAGDARNMFDGHADAMITDDPAVIDYAQTRPHAHLAPLAWDRAYFLISTSRVRALITGKPVAEVSRALGEELARDAIRTAARGGSSLIVDSEAACGIRESTTFSVPPSFEPGDRRIVYDASDPTARDLSERIVALAAMDTAKAHGARSLALAVPDLVGGKPRASGVAASEFEPRLAGGRDFAYVISMSWDADYPSIVYRFDRAPWLYTSSPLSRELIPLVETRAHFIAITDRIGFVDDGAGNVRIMIPTTERSR
jgi:hypothetical protein